MNGENLHYKVEGSGEALVLIHGLSDSLEYWELLAANLKRDYQVIRFDLPGHGQSKLGIGDMTIDSYAEDLACLLDELDVWDVNLVGFSLGGAVALDFALEYPDRASSLVLMSSFAKVDGHLMNVFNEFKDALNVGFEEFYDLILPRILCRDVIRDNREELEFLKGLLSQTANVSAYIKAIDACSDFDVECELPKIDIPALVLAGKYDEITPADTQRDICSNMANCRVVFLDDVKHNLLVGKNNEKILAILKEFYKKNKR